MFGVLHFCEREIDMISTMVFPGRYIQGYEAIWRLGPEIARLGKAGCVIISPAVHDNLWLSFVKELGKHVRATAIKFGGECGVGLPTTLREVGLPEASQSDLEEVALRAMDEDGPIHNEPAKISRELIVRAIKAADQQGYHRKGLQPRMI